MGKRIMHFCTAVLLIAGLGLLLYPLVSNLYYEWVQNQMTASYDHLVTEQMPQQQRNLQLEECRNYNDNLREGGVLLTDPFDEAQLDPSSMPYAGLLNLMGDGSMGYLEIPAIDVNLVIYHGVQEEVLSKGVGHLQGSSLPVGGTGTHCVLSAHTGLNNKKLFTDLDQLVEGDVFYLHVLDEVLAYQVDQIKVVLPHETSDLSINAEQDYVTLVTCTPYGINSHRLLVRGVRIPYEEAQQVQQVQQTQQRSSTWQQQYLLAMVAGIAGVALVIVVVMVVKAAARALKRRAESRR